MTLPTATTSVPKATSRALPNLRPAVLDDYEQIARLESAHGLLTLSKRDWTSLFLDNPVARQRVQTPIGWVLQEQQGSIVGSLCNVVSRYRLGGNDLFSATGRGWVVEPAYRGVALWLMDEYFNQPNIDLFLNTTVNSMAVDPFTSFGSHRVPVGDWENAAYWVTGYRGFATTALRLKNLPAPGLLSIPAGAALWTRDMIRTRALPGTEQGVTIEHIGEFDHRFDAFWEELIAQNPKRLLGYRNRAALSWHFAGPIRCNHLRIFTASVKGLMRAYCILKRQDHPQSGLIRMRLVDHQTLSPDRDLLPSLLRAALEYCADEDVYTFEHVGCALQKMQAFDQHAPYRRRLPAWPFYYQAPSAALSNLLEDPSVWDPSTYDGDASL